MSINSINSSGATGGINEIQDTQSTQKSATFAGMKIGAGSGGQSKAMDVGMDVKQHGIEQGGSVEKTQETTSTQGASGIFGKFKIGQGTGNLQNMAGGGNVSSHSLSDRATGGIS